VSRDRPGGRLEERLERFLAAYGALLHAAVRRVCPPGVETADVEQETRLRVMRALEREREITDPASYLYRAAASAMVDALRRVRARREVPLTESSEAGADPTGPAATAAAAVLEVETPEAAAIRRETGRHIQKALESLLESRRMPVRLHLQGFSVLEIARLLGTSEPRARNLVYRGLADLRAELQRQGIAR
jgi:RNA polymerase sigma-70 factor (ECF subfamily)